MVGRTLQVFLTNILKATENSIDLVKSQSCVQDNFIFKNVVTRPLSCFFVTKPFLKKMKQYLAQTPEVCFQPSLSCYQHLFDRPTETHSTWPRLGSRQSGPPSDVICLYLRGKKETRSLKFPNAALVLLPSCDSL